jgi:hypothetical protein
MKVKTTRKLRLVNDEYIKEEYPELYKQSEPKAPTRYMQFADIRKGHEKDDCASYLISVAKYRRYVKKKVEMFEQNPRLARYYNYNDVQAAINWAIAKTIRTLGIENGKTLKADKDTLEKYFNVTQKSAIQDLDRTTSSQKNGMHEFSKEDMSSAWSESSKGSDDSAGGDSERFDGLSESLTQFNPIFDRPDSISSLVRLTDTRVEILRFFRERERLYRHINKEWPRIRTSHVFVKYFMYDGVYSTMSHAQKETVDKMKAAFGKRGTRLKRLTGRAAKAAIQAGLALIKEKEPEIIEMLAEETRVYTLNDLITAEANNPKLTATKTKKKSSAEKFGGSAAVNEPTFGYRKNQKTGGHSFYVRISARMTVDGETKEMLVQEFSIEGAKAEKACRAAKVTNGSIAKINNKDEVISKGLNNLKPELLELASDYILEVSEKVDNYRKRGQDLMFLAKDYVGRRAA